MSDNEPRCTTCGLPTHPDYGDPHECPAGFLTDSPSVPTTQGEREALDAQHFDDVSCIQCGHPVAEHVGNPCCRVCFGEGKRGRYALCVRDEKCPVDGQLATKHEGWATP